MEQQKSTSIRQWRRMLVLMLNNVLAAASLHFPSGLRLLFVSVKLVLAFQRPGDFSHAGVAFEDAAESAEIDRGQQFLPYRLPFLHLAHTPFKNILSLLMKRKMVN